MAYIEIVPPEEAEGALKVEYDHGVARGGWVWNIVRMMSPNPRVLRASMRLYWETVAERPIAPRGGVMLLPLGARHPGTSWPPTLGLTMSDGTRLHGQVIWFAPSRSRPAARRRWTDEPPRPFVRAVVPTDDSSDPAAGAQCDQRRIQVAAFKFNQHGAEHHRTGGTKGMTHGNRTAVHVYLLVGHIHQSLEA